MDFLNPLVSEWQQLISNPAQPLQILFWTFAAAVLIQLLFYWTIFVRLLAHRIPDLRITDPKPPVSVVIAARDEYLNLYENLPSILEQDYPNFEVIVVNNDSTDESAILLRNFQQQYPHLNVITLERNLNFFKGKKFPLSLGIRTAKNDILIFTDADCKPSSPQWINHMQSGFLNDTGIVLGIGQYRRAPGLLNLLVRYETFMVALQYLSFAIAGMPYMGVGRNLAYRKSLFLRQKGFISHYNIASGDDDLFVNRAAGSTTVNIRVHPDAHTFSRPVNSFKRFYIQKRRHLTTAKYYKTGHKLILGLWAVSTLTLFTTLAINLALQKFLILTSILFLLKWISQFIILKKTSQKLHFQLLCVLSPVLELLLIFVQGIVGVANFFSKPKKWK
jgi:poly-beta-1,6-N-acetyl-D-glucosamine synthase